MFLIRTLHIRKYDPNRRRFPSNCFHPLGDGISVFKEDCALQKSNNLICQHINYYYPTTVGTPVIYCRIDAVHLANAPGFENMIIEHTPSISGDDCHVDIKNVNKKQSGNYAKANFRPPAIFMCCDGVAMQLAEHEYEDLLNNLC